MSKGLRFTSLHGFTLSLPGASEVRVLPNEHRTHRFKVEVGYRDGNDLYVRTTKPFRRISEAVAWLEWACAFPTAKLGRALRVKMQRPTSYVTARLQRVGTRSDGYAVRLYPFSGGGYNAALHNADHSTHLETLMPTKEEALAWLARIRVPKL